MYVTILLHVYMYVVYESVHVIRRYLKRKSF